MKLVTTTSTFEKAQVFSLDGDAGTDVNFFKTNVNAPGQLPPALAHSSTASSQLHFPGSLARGRLCSDLPGVRESGGGPRVRRLGQRQRLLGLQPWRTLCGDLRWRPWSPLLPAPPTPPAPQQQRPAPSVRGRCSGVVPPSRHTAAGLRVLCKQQETRPPKEQACPPSRHPN